jgi:inorganic pyrophosphatase
MGAWACFDATTRPEENPKIARRVRPPVPESVHCLVEIPKGRRSKYEWNEELPAITLDRFLFSSVVYPTD